MDGRGDNGAAAWRVKREGLRGGARLWFDRHGKSVLGEETDLGGQGSSAGAALAVKERQEVVTGGRAEREKAKREGKGARLLANLGEQREEGERVREGSRGSTSMSWTHACTGRASGRAAWAAARRKWPGLTRRQPGGRTCTSERAAKFEKAAAGTGSGGGAGRGWLGLDNNLVGLSFPFVVWKKYTEGPSTCQRDKKHPRTAKPDMRGPLTIQNRSPEVPRWFSTRFYLTWWLNQHKTHVGQSTSSPLSPLFSHLLLLSLPLSLFFLGRAAGKRGGGRRAGVARQERRCGNRRRRQESRRRRRPSRGRASCPSAPTPPRRVVVVAGEAIKDEEQRGTGPKASTVVGGGRRPPGNQDDGHRAAAGSGGNEGDDDADEEEGIPSGGAGAGERCTVAERWRWRRSRGRSGRAWRRLPDLAPDVEAVERAIAAELGGRLPARAGVDQWVEGARRVVRLVQRLAVEVEPVP